MLPLDQQQRKRRKVPDDQPSDSAGESMAQKPFAQSLQQFLQAPRQFAPTEQIVHDYVDVRALAAPGRPFLRVPRPPDAAAFERANGRFGVSAS